MSFLPTWPAAILDACRRKTSLLAVVVGTLTACASWWFLPSRARVTIPLAPIDWREGHDLIFARNFRFAACSTGHPDDKKRKGETSIWDLHSGRLLCSFPFQNIKSKAFSKDGNQFIEFAEDKTHIRDVQTGNIQVRGDVVEFLRGQAELKNQAPTSNAFAFRTQDNRCIIWDTSTGASRKVPISASHTPALSPDGRYLAVLVNRPDNSHPWVVWFTKWLRLPRSGGEFVLLDLDTASVVASWSATVPRTSFGCWWKAEFSLDGRSMALIANDSLTVYDFPLRRPWLAIVGYGFLAAGLVWMAVLWLGRRGAGRSCWPRQSPP